MEDEYMSVSKVIDASGANSTAVLRAVDELIKMGILEEKREETFPRRRLVRLTDKGKIIRERLREIDKLINMPENINIVRKYLAIDENRNIVAEGNSWEEVEEIMKKKGYKRGQYDILTVVEQEKS
ncbi:hypothetical protein HS5_11320 [Acidianus sp. HS-5]|nr:hypothetical protein HS5_11320 [Acidianus sp. HS-5]